MRADRLVGEPVVVDETSNRLFFRLFQAANTLTTKATQALDEFGVTSTQWSVLGALSRPQASSGMTVGELSKYLLVSRQNLAGVLGRLERDGLVRRIVGSNDRRERTVELTPKGSQLWLELAGPINAFYENALRGFTNEDRAAFIHAISLLQRNMAEYK